MSSNTEHKAQLAIIREAGVEIVEVFHGGRHLRAKCCLPGGRVTTFTMVGSSGDKRLLKNFKAQVRRAIREES